MFLYQYLSIFTFLPWFKNPIQQEEYNSDSSCNRNPPYIHILFRRYPRDCNKEKCNWEKCLFNHTNHLLKHCLFFNRGLQRIKRFLNHFLSYCKFFVCRQFWISSRIRNSGSRNNSVCTYCFRNWNNRSNMCRWDSKTLQCLRHRCTATSTGSSVGSQDCC